MHRTSSGKAAVDSDEDLAADASGDEADTTSIAANTTTSTNATNALTTTSATITKTNIQHAIRANRDVATIVAINRLIHLQDDLL